MLHRLHKDPGWLTVLAHRLLAAGPNAAFLCTGLHLPPPTPSTCAHITWISVYNLRGYSAHCTTAAERGCQCSKALLADAPTARHAHARMTTLTSRRCMPLTRSTCRSIRNLLPGTYLLGLPRRPLAHFQRKGHAARKSLRAGCGNAAVWARWCRFATCEGSHNRRGRSPRPSAVLP
jgi:hypothetical protein